MPIVMCLLLDNKFQVQVQVLTVRGSLLYHFAFDLFIQCDITVTYWFRDFGENARGGGQ